MFCLHTVLRILAGMDDAVACAAVGPDQKQDVLSCGHSVDLIHEVVGVRDGMPVNFENHITGSEARIVGGAARAHALNGRAVHALGNVELLAHIGR